MYIGIGVGTDTQPAQRGFTPTQIGGTLLWLDAADSNTLFQTVGGAAATADGNPVGEWKDKSGNGRNGTNTLTGRPTLKTGIYNGRNTVRFNGTSNFLSLPNFYNLGTDDYTAFIVTKVNTPASFTVIFEQAAPASARRFVFFVGSGAQRYQYYHNSFVGSGILGTSINSIFKAVSSGTSRSFSINNGTPATATLADFDSTGNFTYLGNSSYNEYLNGDICEVLFYNRALSAGDQTLIYNYLAAKWGI
jgi:hypothetical protein